MSILTRAGHYTEALLGLRALNRRTAQLSAEPRRVIQETFRFAGGFLEPIQVEDEITALVTDVRTLRPRTIIEIGTSMGGTLYLWTRFAAPDAIIISIDLPRGKFGGGYSPLRIPLYRLFARERQRVHLLRCDSHSADTLLTVRELLEGNPVDFLFIDGDHTYDGVRKDWENYGALVRPGGLMALHDVGKNYDDTEVKRFWDEVKGRFQYREYLAHPSGFYGIGSLYK
jgi:predicted O-methyltransferase YrrM